MFRWLLQTQQCFVRRIRARDPVLSRLVPATRTLPADIVFANRQRLCFGTVHPYLPFGGCGSPLQMRRFRCCLNLPEVDAQLGAAFAPGSGFWVHFATRPAVPPQRYVSFPLRSSPITPHSSPDTQVTSVWPGWIRSPGLT